MDGVRHIFLTLLQRGFALGPLLFGLLFLPPVIAELMLAFNWMGPFGLSPLAVGFVVGAPAGLAAQMTGRWIPGAEL